MAAPALRMLPHLACGLALAALVWLAYAPSLRHAPRSDQWCVLVDTLNNHTFLDTLASTYSYNRTRRIAPGDTDLFRPVLFALLAAEKSACAADLGAAQMIGILLHGIVCILALVLLQQIAAWNRPECTLADVCMPYAVVGFFALSPSVQELVIWTHLHGYLLFLALVLGSANLLFRHIAQSNCGSWRSPCLWLSGLLTLIACFTYELGQVYAILAGLVFAAASAPRIGRRPAALRFAAFASLALAYQMVNAIDVRSHPGEFVPDNNHRHIGERMFRLWTLEHSGRFAVYTVMQPYFPSMIETRFQGDRLEVLESLWSRHGRRNPGPAVVISFSVIALSLMLFGAGTPRLVRPELRLHLLVVLLFGTLFAVYSGMNVLGRMNLRPTPEILSSNSYYTYFALLFALIAGFAAASAVEPAAEWVAKARSVLLVGFVVLAVIGAERVRQVNQAVAAGLSEIAKPIRTVNAFVRQHRREPDFSFRIDYTASDRIVPVYGLPTTDVMFAEWMTPREPKYRIAIRNGAVIVLAVKPESRSP